MIRSYTTKCRCPMSERPKKWDANSQRAIGSEIRDQRGIDRPVAVACRKPSLRYTLRQRRCKHCCIVITTATLAVDRSPRDPLSVYTESSCVMVRAQYLLLDYRRRFAGA